VCNSDVEFVEGSEEKTLVRDCRISDGSLLYVEALRVSYATGSRQGAYNNPGLKLTPLWFVCEQADGVSLLKQRFEAEQNTIEVNFNNPNTDETDIMIAIDQRETIGTLKKRIGKHLAFPECMHSRVD
jgi:hypothetical protein